MSCLSASAIAEVASRDAVDPHVASCVACRRKVDEDRALRRQLARFSVPPFSAARKREVAAELAARAERIEAPRSKRWIGFAGALAAAAATVAVIAWPRAVASSRQGPIAGAASEELAMSSRSIAQDEPIVAAPLVVPPVPVAAPSADRVTLSDGVLELDTRGSRAVDVQIGEATVQIADSKVVLRARDHAIVSVSVVVGAARITAPDQRIVVESGTLWQAPPPPSLQAFRDAWVALRAGDNRAAIAAFDTVTDPSVAEEAAFWAAIAAKRAGDASNAHDRLVEFLRRYPQSPYAARARAAIASH